MTNERTHKVFLALIDYEVDDLFGRQVSPERAHRGSGSIAIAKVPIDFGAARLAGFRPGWYQRVVKPVFDVVGAFALLIITLPVFVLIALAVLTTMGRPAIFTQSRVGQDGQRFTMFKFRTMIADRRSRREPFNGEDRRLVHKSPTDPRVTRLGRFLRKWSLDELPQFWNVLLLQMSLVGPRPEVAEVVDAKYAPWQHRRHAVKPGVTGLWQISERDDELMLFATHIDLHYIEKASFLIDLKILALTPLAALGYRRSAQDVLD